MITRSADSQSRPEKRIAELLLLSSADSQSRPEKRIAEILLLIGSTAALVMLGLDLMAYEWVAVNGLDHPTSGLFGLDKFSMGWAMAFFMFAFGFFGALGLLAGLVGGVLLLISRKRSSN